MLKLGKNCHNRNRFIDEHSLAYKSAAAGTGEADGDGMFPVGTDFFTIESDALAHLQSLVDNTHKLRKKLSYVGKKGGERALRAKALIAEASSGSQTIRFVRWGLHQSEERPMGFTGKCEHFTIQGKPDWHLYVATGGNRISFMSDGPEQYVSIMKD
jgi:hypothetical protein